MDWLTLQVLTLNHQESIFTILFTVHDSTIITNMAYNSRSVLFYLLFSICYISLCIKHRNSSDVQVNNGCKNLHFKLRPKSNTVTSLRFITFLQLPYVTTCMNTLSIQHTGTNYFHNHYWFRHLLIWQQYACFQLSRSRLRIQIFFIHKNIDLLYIISYCMIDYKNWSSIFIYFSILWK
jgi:hypothetical protein